MPDPITLGLLAVAGVGGVVAARSTDGGGGDDTAEADQSGGSDGGSDGGAAPVTLSYSTEFWRPVVVRLCGDQPAEFHMAWIQVESNGNPAAVGSIHATGPDGYALEMGLYQLYNPDELKLAGVSSSDIRPDGAMYKTGSQTLLRPLTSDEQEAQIRAGVAYIAKRRAKADADLSAFGATWSERDVWRLVKCYHALTGLPRAALAGYAATNGGPPANWDAFRAYAQSADLTPYGGANLAKYAPYTKVLNNAEKVGGVVAE